MKVSKYLKVIFINFTIFLALIIIFELFLGSWFKNNFNYKLSSDRNINRVYKLDFKYHKTTSHYIKNSYAFRISNININPSDVDIAFVGGSTTNQKFIKYDETIVGIIANQNKNLSIVNAGIDGMSIKGHINSFELWFDKINDFKPKYFVYMLGINDRYLIKTKSFRDHVDNLEESTIKGNIREYFESNSFFYTQARKIKSLLFLKYNLELGLKKVKKNHVYLDRDKVEFVSYNEREKMYNELNKVEKSEYINFKKWYLKKLLHLTNLIKNRNSTPIYITQTTGYGHSFESYIVAKSIIRHCKIEKLVCLDLAKNLNLKYEDFYDESHLNSLGSKKVAEYIHQNLFIFK